MTSPTVETGPTQHQRLHSRIDPDGRWHHTIRQSTISSLTVCPERARLEIAGLTPRIETDATAAGTALHAAIETAWVHLMATGNYLSVRKIQKVAADKLTELSAADNYREVSHTTDWLHTFLANACVAFDQVVYRAFWPDLVEHSFDQLVIHEDDERIIDLSGTIDIVTDQGPLDWKTAGDPSKYSAGRGGKAWELDRWDTQSSVYTWACVQLGLLDPDAESWPFTWVAFPKQGKQLVQVHRTTRTAGDHAFLKRRLLSWVPLFEANLPQWPLNDQSALCSPKWCPVWDTCKGADVGPVWPVKGKDLVLEPLGFTSNVHSQDTLPA